MKKSEARILIFLSQAPDRLKYARYMSNKLDMDYGYLLRNLASMKLYKMVTCTKRGLQKFYQVTDPKYATIAKNRLANK